MVIAYSMAAPMLGRHVSFDALITSIESLAHLFVYSDIVTEPKIVHVSGHDGTA